ncbi:GbsR/MarR family transcriptional regulator [Phaeacidiphilus oryzae]|uniref:GbsR/MarR family transcriptional regulator n=1 Tax=Phaeacidiphilus oryzae TaxID=348818 RepID=UPI0007C6F8E9|nr:MarR family transcriptional regulator [Phaeacidiphilus oryzae]
MTDPAPTASAASGASDGEQRLRAYLESFALVMAESGLPRMPARIFAALLLSEDGRLTAGELADLLQVSPAAVSGGVRYLTTIGLAARERDPGSRRDHYRIEREDVWYESAYRRESGLRRWMQSLDEGIDLVGPDSRAGRRLTESRAFFDFLLAELPTLMDRWRDHRDRLFGEADGDGGPDRAGSDGGPDRPDADGRPGQVGRPGRLNPANRA